MRSSRTGGLLALFAAGIPISSPVRAEWPARTVTIVVPFAAGGLADALARLSAERLNSKLGQPFVIENASGASGVVAANRVRRAPPDGYTLFFAGTPQISIAPHVQKLDFDPQQAFVPISAIATSPFLITVAKSQGIDSLDSLIKKAKSEPGGLIFGTAGPLTFSNMSVMLFAKVANVELRPVHYRGLAPAIPDLLAGHIFLLAASPNELGPFLESGQLKPLISTAPTSNKALANVPVLSKLFPAAPDVISWLGLVASAGTPETVVDKISAIVMEAERDPVFIVRLEKIGVEPIVHTPAQFRQQIREESAKWKDILGAIEVRPSN